MGKVWYTKVGRNVCSNIERDSSINQECLPDKEDIEVSLKDTVSNLNAEIDTSQKSHLKAVAKTGQFIIDHGPVVKTQDVSKFYKDVKHLNANTK